MYIAGFEDVNCSFWTIGAHVWDDLTRQPAVVVGFMMDQYGNVGYRIDSEYLDGYRFPWEISNLNKDRGSGMEPPLLLSKQHVKHMGD